VCNSPDYRQWHVDIEERRAFSGMNKFWGTNKKWISQGWQNDQRLP